MQESRITFYIKVTSYYLLHQLRVNFYLRVTSYYLLYDWQVKLSYELRITIYCTTWDCNIDHCVKVLYYTSYSFLWVAICKIKYSSSAVPKQCISWMSALTLSYHQFFFYLSCVKRYYIFMTYFLQHEVFLASCYWAINFVNVCSNGKLYATKL